MKGTEKERRLPLHSIRQLQILQQAACTASGRVSCAPRLLWIRVRLHPNNQRTYTSIHTHMGMTHQTYAGAHCTARPLSSHYYRSLACMPTMVPCTDAEQGTGGSEQWRRHYCSRGPHQVETSCAALVEQCLRSPKTHAYWRPTATDDRTGSGTCPFRHFRKPTQTHWCLAINLSAAAYRSPATTARTREPISMYT